VAGEDEEIAAEDGAPDVGVEGGHAPPGAAVETEDAFEPRDDALNAGAEAALGAGRPSHCGPCRRSPARVVWRKQGLGPPGPSGGQHNLEKGLVGGS
jgi:hypothetical protein